MSKLISREERRLLLLNSWRLYKEFLRKLTYSNKDNVLRDIFWYDRKLGCLRSRVITILTSKVPWMKVLLDSYTSDQLINYTKAYLRRRNQQLI